jgi:hypothetical protein
VASSSPVPEPLPRSGKTEQALSLIDKSGVCLLACGGRSVRLYFSSNSPSIHVLPLTEPRLSRSGKKHVGLLNRIFQRNSPALIYPMRRKNQFDPPLQVQRQRNSHTEKNRHNANFHRIDKPISGDAAEKRSATE